MRRPKSDIGGHVRPIPTRSPAETCKQFPFFEEMKDLSTATSSRNVWCGRVCGVAFVVLVGFMSESTLEGQCAGIASTPAGAADCAAHSFPVKTVATVDPRRPYGLAE